MLEIFKSQKLMKSSTITIVLCALYMIVRNIIKNNSIEIWCETFCLVLVSAIYSILVYITYVKHDENAMKPAIGMLLGSIVFQSLGAFCSNIFSPEELNYYIESGVMGYVSLFLDSMQFLINIVFCVNHIIISSGHKSLRKQLKYNQTLCVALAIIYVLQVVVSAFVFYPEKVLYLFVFYLLMLCNLVVVLCVETKLDYFRELRENK